MWWYRQKVYRRRHILTSVEASNTLFMLVISFVTRPFLWIWQKKAVIRDKCLTQFLSKGGHSALRKNLQSLWSILLTLKKSCTETILSILQPGFPLSLTTLSRHFRCCVVRCPFTALHSLLSIGSLWLVISQLSPSVSFHFITSQSLSSFTFSGNEMRVRKSEKCGYWLVFVKGACKYEITSLSWYVFVVYRRVLQYIWEVRVGNTLHLRRNTIDFFRRCNEIRECQ